MLDPNGVSCTLYPEEVAALLDRDVIADVDTATVLPGREPQVRAVEYVPAWLRTRLAAALTAMPVVTEAYLVEINSPDAPNQWSYLIALRVPAQHAERAARAVLLAIQRECARRECALDLTAFDPTETLPPWLAGSMPVYHRHAH